MANPPSRSRCPITRMLDLLGDRWSLLIVRDIVLFDKRRYSEFLAAAEGISTNILAQRLKQLEQYGLIEKFADPHDGKSSLYLPTEEGLNLLPVLIEVMRWGTRERSRSAIPVRLQSLLDRGSEPFLSERKAEVAAERDRLKARRTVS